MTLQREWNALERDRQLAHEQVPNASSNIYLPAYRREAEAQTCLRRRP